jgi:hypothetical protein
MRQERKVKQLAIWFIFDQLCFEEKYLTFQRKVQQRLSVLTQQQQQNKNKKQGGNKENSCKGYQSNKEKGYQK